MVISKLMDFIDFLYKLNIAKIPIQVRINYTFCHWEGLKSVHAKDQKNIAGHEVLQWRYHCRPGPVIAGPNGI